MRLQMVALQVLLLLCLIKPLQANEVKDIFLFAYRNFDYKTDLERFGVSDYRKSFYDDLKQNKRFSGDCDDFAYTVRDLLVEKGYKPELWIVAVPPRIWRNGVPGYHMVVKVQDKNGFVWMLDNRYPRPRKWLRGVRGSMYEVKLRAAYWPTETKEKWIKNRNSAFMPQF